ncbi:lipopolysaccharide biosynthesis protein [Rhizobium leucaenae]|uniref:O-antigen/teichoic acid export membrane protein n=1 Tax=Rhizobium leucaenae TaxID=29450 RepID=A0A7W6ZUW6_9HYPH|nr:lipopolysaccharide biosynthesis protein [Rhizobium leucaenae]MBB4569213.1 O-antigen/teichoic acid export membrane protein [Rhizobium leucaenae]MBB6300130.1 O-antigen/teichoic acid export membrane protein [Rhizobium leucaenae]
MSTSGSNLLKSSLISLAATVISLAAGFASSIIAARLLGPAGSGKVAYALWVATSATALADMGLPQTLLRNAGGLSGEGDAWKALVRAALRSFLISVAMVGAAILVFAAITYVYRDARHAWFWIVTALLFLSYAFYVLSTAVARGRHRFGQTARSTALAGLLQVPLVLAGAWLLGPTGALIGYVARYLPQALQLRGYIDRSVPASSNALTPEMQRYGRYIWLSDLIEILVLSRVEFLFLGFFFSSTGIGYFAAGLGLAGLIEQVMLQISPALIVSFADAHAKGDQRALQAAYGRVIRMVALVMLPISFGGAAIMPDLMPLIFGDAFEPAIPAAATLLAFVWLAGLSVIPWGMISASGRSDLLLRVQITSGLLTMLLLAAMVPLAGLEGAALARATIATLTFLLLARTAWKNVHTVVPLVAVAKTIFAAAFCAAAAGLAVYCLDGLAAIASAIPAGAIAYMLAVRLLHLVESGDSRLLMDTIGGKLPGPSRPLINGLLAFLAPG